MHDLKIQLKEGKITQDRYDDLYYPKLEKFRDICDEWGEATDAAIKELANLRSGGRIKLEEMKAAASDFKDLRERIESRSAKTAAGKPVYSGNYNPSEYKRRRFTKRHATSRYTGKVRSRKHGDVNILLETCYSDALHVYKLLCRKLRNFNEKDSKSSLAYNRLLTKLRKKSEKIYLKLKKHKKATASDFVILAKLKRLEIKSNKQLQAKR